jgi:CBS domain-containing protein
MESEQRCDGGAFERMTSVIPIRPTGCKSAIIRDPIMVTPNTTVMDAIALMSSIRSVCPSARNADLESLTLQIEARSSCVLVVEDDRLLGILTERDVVRLSAQQQSLENLSIGRVMTQPVITVQESACTDIFAVVNLLQQKNIRHLVVLDDRDRIAGLLTHENLRQLSRPADLLRLRLVGEVMTAQVVCADPADSMQKIAGLMTEHRVSSVVIMQEPEKSLNIPLPVGIITERDIVQFQSLGLNLERVAAATVMSTPVFAVSPHESLWTVHQIMTQRSIHRIVVTGVQGELLGIVTQSSLLKVLNPIELYTLTEILEQKVSQLGDFHEKHYLTC